VSSKPEISGAYSLLRIGLLLLKAWLPSDPASNSFASILAPEPVTGVLMIGLFLLLFSDPASDTASALLKFDSLLLAGANLDS
jgi:hypothetical protein